VTSFLLVILTISVLRVALLTYSRVDNRVATEDIHYLQKITSKGSSINSLTSIRAYEEELDFVRGIQKAVQEVVARGECLSLSMSREPKDVYLVRCGKSYDRSRVIEKALRYAGFQTRYIMIFSTLHTGSRIKALLSQGGFSHSVTETLTQNGWLVIDPDDSWFSLDKRGKPVSLVDIQSVTNKKIIPCNEEISKNMPHIYKEPFVFVYGLYSRHGKFYPPYNFIPDINWREFVYNIMTNS
jgi:hypothetical protein